MSTFLAEDPMFHNDLKNNVRSRAPGGLLSGDVLGPTDRNELNVEQILRSRITYGKVSLQVR